MAYTYIHRCFVVFRNALITHSPKEPTAASGAGAGAAAVVAAAAVVPSGAARPVVVRFSWLFHSRLATTSPATRSQRHTHTARIPRTHRTSVVTITIIIVTSNRLPCAKCFFCVEQIFFRSGLPRIRTDTECFFFLAVLPCNFHFLR